MIRFEQVSVTYGDPDASAGGTPTGLAEPVRPAGPAVQGVDLTVPEGELCLLVGPSGVGKSTLLNAVSGLVPHFTGGTLRGRVTVAGRDTRTHKPRELADVVGTVGQDPLAHFVTDVVEDELAYGMESLGLAPDVMRRRVEETLDLLGLAELRDRAIATLSGGQRQRVAIGSVLTTHPKVLVLDEPTSALDPAAAEEVLAVLQRLVHDLGTTVLLAEHRLERVVQYADQVILLPSPGAAPVIGAPADIMAVSPVHPPVVALGRLASWSPLPLSVRDARRRAATLRTRLAELPPPPHGTPTTPTTQAPPPVTQTQPSATEAQPRISEARAHTTEVRPHTADAHIPAPAPKFSASSITAPPSPPSPSSAPSGSSTEARTGAGTHPTASARPSLLARLRLRRRATAMEGPAPTGDGAPGPAAATPPPTEGATAPTAPTQATPVPGATTAAPEAASATPDHPVTATSTGTGAPIPPPTVTSVETPPAAPVAEVARLSVRRGRIEALGRVDLAVRPGETIALMGRNGAGKSTLLSTLVGMHEPSAGSVRVGGAEPHRTEPRELLRLVGLVPQEPRDLLYADTVAAECAAADRDAGASDGTCRDLVTRLLPDVADTTHPRDLSEGQRLALALAVILTARPPLLLLDEPTRGLDYAAKARLVEILRGLSAEGHATVLATHDVELAAELAHRVVILADGEIVADGPTAEVVVSSPSFAPQVAKILAPLPWLTVPQVRDALEATA